MRQKLTSEMRRQRSQRRAVLAALILASATPSIAADPAGSLRIISPLPLSPDAPTRRVQDNPFCEPVLAPTLSPLVQLASDQQVSAIRMKPIGVAVGLRSIGEPDAASVPEILVTPTPASQIQINPMIGSSHDNDTPLSEVVVTESGKPKNLTWQKPSTETFNPFVPPQPSDVAEQSSPSPSAPSLVQPLLDQWAHEEESHQGPAADEMVGQEWSMQEFAQDELAVQEIVDQELVEHENVDQEVVNQELVASDAATQAAPLETAPSMDEPVDRVNEPVDAANDPVLFSMTDADEDAGNESDAGNAADTRSLADVIGKPTGLSGIKPVQVVDPIAQAKSNRPFVAAAAPLIPIDLSHDPAPALKQAPGDNTSQTPNRQPTNVSKHAGVVASLVSKSNRYRPPVAVSSAPVPMVRNESTAGISLVRPAVTRVESLHLDDTPAVYAESYRPGNDSRVVQASAAVDLHMNKAQVRTLTIGGTFRRIALADQAVCQAINAGANELKLIGTGCGVTELRIWADTGNGGEPKVRVFRIHVEDAVDTQGESVQDKTETLNQSIARAFPRCRVRVHQEDGQLVVMGDCDSEKSASDILRMIRKTCLIPVVDELRIR